MKASVLFFASFLLFWNASFLSAQEVESAPQNSFSISVEILAPILGGFIAEGGYNFGKNRLAASWSTVGVPEFYNSQSDLFTPTRQYIDLFYTRFINDEQTGFHYGLSFGYIYQEKVEQVSTGLEREKDYFRGGIRLGYFWNPWRKKDTWAKGLFVEPGMNIAFAFNDKDLVFPGTTDNTFAADIPKITGPLLNLGYKF